MDPSPSPLPGELNPGDFVELDSLDLDRKKLLERALRPGREHRLQGTSGDGVIS